MDLTLVNGDETGSLTGTEAMATVTGAVGPVTFTASRRPTGLSPSWTAISGELQLDGRYLLTLPDRWLWYVKASDGVTTAEAPVWAWTSNYVVDLEVAEAARQIIYYNRGAIEARAREIVPGWEIKDVLLGMREQVDVVPAIEVSAAATSSEWLTAPYGRKYTFQLQMCIYTHWTDDVQSDQQLLIQASCALRDVLMMYEMLSLDSGLYVANFVPNPVQFMETLNADGKIIGMATMTWACTAEWAIPPAT